MSSWTLDDRRRWVTRLLAPYLAGIACFAGAFQVMEVYQTNRTALDLYLALAGYICVAIGLIATGVAAYIRPWRQATAQDYLWLAAHVGAAWVALSMASDWMGKHIA